MKEPVIVIGLGEMGSVFARGMLRCGHPVFPVTRETDMQACAGQLPQPALVLVAVGEKDLQPVLERIPETWKDRLALLQNELLPNDWAALPQPTVISVWFEKKRGMDSKVIIPSPVYGPRAGMLTSALDSIGIASRELDSAEDLLFELVAKNLYILTTNIAGLEVGGNVGELWAQQQTLAREIADEVLQLQEGLTGKQFDRERMIGHMVQAFEGDPLHNCMGRSAPARLERALQLGAELGIELPVMKKIAADVRLT